MLMRASFKLQILEVPKRFEGKMSPLVLSAAGYRDVDDAERERIWREVQTGQQLIKKAKRPQQLLLDRLVRAAGPRGLRFRLLSTLEQFLAATKSVDAKRASTPSDAELAKLWD